MKVKYTIELPYTAQPTAYVHDKLFVTGWVSGVFILLSIFSLISKLYQWGPEVRNASALKSSCKWNMIIYILFYDIYHSYPQMELRIDGEFDSFEDGQINLGKMEYRHRDSSG